MKVGAHLSIEGSIDRAVDRAVERKCTTFQIFTRSPRGWRFRPLERAAVEEFKAKLQASEIDPVASHMPYLPNLASSNNEIYRKSVDALVAELDRAGTLSIRFVITHLGSHIGAGMEAGLRQITHACNRALSTVQNNVQLLLENTAGSRNSMGGTFEDMRSIIDGIDQRDRVGVCFDTCHGFAAGYDMRTPERLGSVLEQLNAVIGLDRLKVVHLNDSKGKLGSHLDRHEHIGLGHIGGRGFQAILHNRLIRTLPLILETPIDSRRSDMGNLRKVHQLAK
jgi:deoxyribonuclease-4